MSSNRAPRSNPFWRVNVERWGFDDNIESLDFGMEIFWGGESIPFATREDAVKYASQKLVDGSEAWVQVIKYE